MIHQKYLDKTDNKYQPKMEVHTTVFTHAGYN